MAQVREAYVQIQTTQGLPSYGYKSKPNHSARFVDITTCYDRSRFEGKNYSKGRAAGNEGTFTNSMGDARRTNAYAKQNNGGKETPAQRRRARKKVNSLLAKSRKGQA